MLSSDIDEVILAALSGVFTLELITALAGDVLQLKTLKQSDLQDDPTQVAPWLVYRPDIDKGNVRMPKELEHMYGGSEIGGPAKYVHAYEGRFGTPPTTTRNLARSDIGTLASRVQAALEKYYDLSYFSPQTGILTSPDYSRRIEGANILLVDKVVTRIEGGEQFFFGAGSIFWHYPVAYYQQIGSLL